MGRQDVYLNLLRKFAAHYRHAADHTRAALSQGDRDTALRLAHTVKGLAGNVGAIVLQDAARQLESALKQPETPAALPGLLDGFERALRAVMETLDTHLPALPEAAALSSAAVDPTQLKATCQRLAQLLIDSDFEAIAVWHAHEPMLRQGLGADFAAIAQAIESFEYETALKTLRAAVTAQNME